MESAHIDAAIDGVSSVKRIKPDYHPESYGFLASASSDEDSKEDFSRCEDAQPAIERLPNRQIFMGIADGLGGYRQGVDGNSGGKIASDIAIHAALEFFRGLDEQKSVVQRELTTHIFEQLRRFADQNLPKSRVKGSLGRHKLATTLATALITDQKSSGSVAIDLYWIGDSRIYFFSSLGLHQLTTDDSLTDVDAYRAVYQPPPMSKFLAATMETQWCINYDRISVDCPGLLMICSDGCFSEWETPWMLEIALQKALDKSKGWWQWAWQFKESLDEIRSDDASMVVHPLFLDSFQQFQILRKRKAVFNAARIADRMARKNPQNKERIWEQVYKPVYQANPTSNRSANSINLEEQGRKTMPDEPHWVIKPDVSKSTLILDWITRILSGAPLRGTLTRVLEILKQRIRSLWPFI